MNRLLRRSFTAAIGIHLGLLVSGGALAPRFHPRTEADSLRTVDVALDEPEQAAAQTSLPAAAPPAAAKPLLRLGHIPFFSTPPIVEPRSAMPAGANPVRSNVPTAAGRAGGALNLGSGSSHGDLAGLPTGQTPVGWVPGADNGKGAGSGSEAGTGVPEPPAVPVTTPQPQPAAVEPPKSVAPPPPRRVRVRVCAASRLLPNPYCPDVVSEEFNEGSEPHGVCSLHKAPPPKPEPAPQPVKPEEPRFTPARLVHTEKPQYPHSAVEEGNEGAVTVQVEVRADGSAGDVSVVRPSGSRLLDAAAVRSVKRWKWEPARRGETPVVSSVRCRVRFTLEE